MPIGIENYGNTCYINSILQNLLATPDLVNYFTENEFKNDFSRIHTETSPDKIIRTVSFNFYKLIQKINENNENKNIKNNVMNLRILFTNYIGQHGQHDSQEFLNFILDKIHEETKCSINIEYKNIPENVVNYCRMIKNLSDNEIMKLQKTYFEEDCIFKFFKYWETFLNKNYSSIINIFGGTYITQLQCLSCKTTNINYEYMTTLPLSIIDDKKVELIDLVNNYFKSELLDGDNKYNCEICKSKTDAIKTSQFWNPPNNLIILLKKYSNDLSKKNVSVNYPLDLDISYYVSPIKNKHWKVNGIYELYGITKHLGTIDFGHYISYVKSIDGDNWYKCDDESITKILDRDVLNSDCYILWYKKK